MKLKPCPFCGEEAQLAKLGKQVWVMRCTQCECKLNQVYRTEQQAIEAWNRREPIDKIVENLEEKVAEACEDYNNYEDSYYEGKEDGVREAIEIVKGGQMRILTKCGMEIYCLPDTAECGMTEKSPEEMGSCPIYNFDDTGDICVPELCDFYGE